MAMMPCRIGMPCSLVCVMLSMPSFRSLFVWLGHALPCCVGMPCAQASTVHGMLLCSATLRRYSRAVQF